MPIHLKAPWELSIMRANGRRLAEVAAAMREAVCPGSSTAALNEVARREIERKGAIPSFLDYAPEGMPAFPGCICASVNDAVVHGIPNERVLVAGDVLSLDVGLLYGGYHADMAFTVVVGGNPTPEQALLLDATEKSLYMGIAQAVSGNRVGDIGFAIESSIPSQQLGLVRQFVGHGIGRALHERPSVPNHGKKNTGVRIKTGMCLAVEPMVTLGSWKTRILEDGWTAVTLDGSCAAHFEHTIAVTPSGAEVLTTLADSPSVLSDIIR
jgi:methionyl aminopeptidase